MSYKSYSEQLQEHVQFMRDCGLDVSLEMIASSVGKGFTRCQSLDDKPSRRSGDLSFKIELKPMDQENLVGVLSWCRGRDGTQDRHRSYGMKSDEVEINDLRNSSDKLVQDERKQHEIAARSAYGFWINSSTQGSSEYLKVKGIGSYGIRFRETDKYGCVAVVPLRDRDGKIWNYQILNGPQSPVGKVFAKDARTRELFHVIGKVVDGSPIGIAESYVTAATCYELSGICSVSAFGCENLAHIVRIFREMYPRSEIILWADSDRHTAVNRGLIKAHEAAQSVGSERAFVIEPDFGDIAPARDASDWNDLMIKTGRDAAQQQLMDRLRAYGIIIALD
jgi:phage/plasmid primase-like uncharacterized protein